MTEMTAPLAVYGQFGQALGLAEKTLSAILRAHLAERDTEPETWYALQLIAARGPSYARTALIDALESPNFDAGSASALLARLESDGFIDGDEALDLTAAGEALHRSLREYISAPAARLLSQFDFRDIETTVRTLQALTARAAEGLSSLRSDPPSPR